MNLRTESLIADYKPELAVIVYKADANKYYLEAHSINDNGQVLEGKPLMQETLDAIVDTFFDERKSRNQIEGLIPDNLLYFVTKPGGKYHMTWYRPAEVRMLHFKENLHMKNGTTWVPAMLYVADGNDLTVFALGSDARPKETAVIYRAPFHNIYADGRVCLGSAKVKKPAVKSYAAEMKYWEDLFWLSEFTHLNEGDNPTKTNINTLWKRLIASKETIRWNKLGELKPFKKATLKTLLK